MPFAIPATRTWRSSKPWVNGKFEEIDLDKWGAASPRYLLANNFAGVAQGDIKKLKKA